MIRIGMLARNKWVSRAVDIGYILGLILSIEGGWFLKYILYTTILFCVLFHKSLYKFMKMGGDMYADWCMAKSYKITKKFYPDYEDKRSEELIKAEKLSKAKKKV